MLKHKKTDLPDTVYVTVISKPVFDNAAIYMVLQFQMSAKVLIAIVYEDNANQSCLEH